MTILFLWLLSWQQKVDYKISASLDTTAHTLKINEILTYYNYSSVALETLYLHLYPNAYRGNNTVFAKELKKMGSYRFLRAKVSDRGWIDISSITDKDCDTLVFEIDETIMAVLLKRPLESGDSVILNINAMLKIPAIFSRLGHKGQHYEIVQWYPKPCVFDESGWHKEPYHAIGEFYGEFGTFDVVIDLPEEYVVAATGILIDSIRCDNRKRSRFFAQNVHDFAWVCDPNFEIATEEIDSILIEVYYIKKDWKKWRNASSYAADAVKRYNSWFGKYPYKKLSVVQGYYGGGMEYPNLVIIGGSENSFTRQFEVVIIHEIAHQWFYGMLGSNEMDEAWLDEGFTSYAEARYFVDKYGIDNTFLKPRLLPALRHNYIHRFNYYIALTNGLEMPVFTKASLFVDVPFAYQVAAYSKPALFLRYLEGYLGTSTFDDILKTYFENYKFRHPKSEDFIELCEEVGGVNLRNFFADFLHTTKYCDWHIRKINKNSLIVENKGEFLLPVDIFVETDNGGQVLRVDKQLDTLSFAAAKKIKKVAIDPYDYIPESNRFNNFYPRKFAVKPIFDWPSFDTYQVFFLPYLWYDSDDGFTPGILYLAGAQFIDADFIKGKNQWTFGYIYGVKSKKHYYSFSYQTPLIFKRGYRSRIFSKGSNSNDEIEYRVGFINDFGLPLTAKSKMSLKTFLSFNNLKTVNYMDSIDWTIAKYYRFQNQFVYNTGHWYVKFNFSGTHKYFNEDWNFAKYVLEFEKTSKLCLRPVWLRIFAGKIFGTVPTQEKLFLSGALRHTIITDLFFGQKGYASPQEHIHIKQDGNMPGYQGMHIKSNSMFSLNIQLPEGFFLRLFCDYGYYYNTESLRWQHAYDAGIKLVLGPVSFILPIYIKDQFWPKNWSVELLSVGVGF